MPGRLLWKLKELKERRAPDSVRKTEKKRNYEISTAHFPNAQMYFTVSNRLLSIHIH